MDRLHVLDAEFLHLEDPLAHMHIGGISVFEGPPPSVGEFHALLDAKMHHIPRYRQRVRSVPLELGRPVWADDPHFDLDYHVRQTALPAPGDDGDLCRLMGRLMSQPLDRDRPLWEDWIVEGLPDGRWASIFKVHHCMVDGVAGVEILSAVLDVAPTLDLGEPRPWEPEPEPSSAALVLDAWRGLAGDLARRTLSMPGMVAHPASTVRSLGDTLAGTVRLGQHLTTTPRLSIEGTIGPHRRWAHSSVGLEDVKTVRRGLGGTGQRRGARRRQPWVPGPACAPGRRPSPGGHPIARRCRGAPRPGWLVMAVLQSGRDAGVTWGDARRLRC